MEKSIIYAKSPTHSILLNPDINMKDKQIDFYTPQNQLIITLDTNDPENMAPIKNINNPYAILTVYFFVQTMMLNNISNIVLLQLSFQNLMNFQQMMPINHIQMVQIYLHRQKFKRAVIFYLSIVVLQWMAQEFNIQSLILFLKSLPENCTFNIISFGDTVEKMFDIAQAYNQQSLNQVIKQAQEMNANLGGTGIFLALAQGIYDNSYSKNKDSPETLNLLLTDGEYFSEKIINLVSQNQRLETRIYMLGIGNNCSEYLVQRFTEVGNGKCQLVGDNEDINSKVIDLLEDSLTQYLKGFSLIHNIDKVSQIIPDPKSITQLKKNQELTLQILFSTKKTQKGKFRIQDQLL